MKYIIPIKIGNRRFTLAELENKSSQIDEFVIDIPDNSNKKILEINFNSNLLNGIYSSTSGTNEDIRIEGTSNCKIDIKDDNKLNINFFENRQKGNKDFGKNDFIKYNINKEEKIICINISAGSLEENKTLDCSINLELKNNSKFSYKCKIHLCKPENLAVVAVDFGSESSQVGIKYWNNTEYNSERINIIDILKKYYNIGEGNIDQIKDKSGKLINTIYAMKKVITSFPKVYGSNQIIFLLTGIGLKEKVKNKLNALLTQEDLNNLEDVFDQTLFLLLPNLKLIKLAQGNMTNTIFFNQIQYSFNSNFPINNGGNFQTIIKHTYNTINNHILYTGIFEILERNIELNRKSFFRIYLLSPNIYTQKQRIEILNEQKLNAKEIIKSICEEKKKEFDDVCGGIEIVSISESDASFSGYIYHIEQIENQIKRANILNTELNIKKYLLIDCGKGTTDISIFDVENKENFVSIYKNGFPAAGQYISFGILMALTKQIGIDINEVVRIISEEKENIKSWIKLMEIVDSFKKVDTGYEITRKKEDIKEQNNDFNKEYNKVINSENLLDFFKTKNNNRYKLYDDDKYIETHIKKIIKKIKEMIKDHKFYKIILTGNSFYFTNFIFEIKKQLKEYTTNNDMDYIVFRDNNLIMKNVDVKKICLDGALSEKGFLYSDFPSSLQIALPKTKDSDIMKMIKDSIDSLDKYLKKEIERNTDNETNNKTYNFNADFFRNKNNIIYKNNTVFNSGSFPLELTEAPSINESLYIFLNKDNIVLKDKIQQYILEEKPNQNAYRDFIYKSLFPTALVRSLYNILNNN